MAPVHSDFNLTKELFGTDGIAHSRHVTPLDDATLYGRRRALGKYLLERDCEPSALIGMGSRDRDPYCIAARRRIADDGVASFGVSSARRRCLPGAAEKILGRHGDFRLAHRFMTTA